MPNEKIFPLLIFLYDVCKEVLEDFFEYKCDMFEADVHDSSLSTFIKSNFKHLCLHKNSKCRKCLLDNNENQQCIPFSNKQLYSLCENNNDVFNDGNLNIWDRFKLKQIKTEELGVQSLQYLILALDLSQDEHDLVVTLYKIRNEVSTYAYKSITDRQFSDLWEESHRILTSIMNEMWNKKQVDRMVKQFERCRKSVADWEIVKPYWEIMKEEFDFEDSALNENCDKKENVDTTRTCIEISGKNIIVGNNNKITTVDQSNHEKLDELLKGQQQLVQILQQCGNLKIQENITSVTGAEGGCHEGELLPLGTDKADKKVEVEVEFKLKTPVNEEELKRIKEYLEGRTITIGEGNVKVQFVHRGSIVIGTTITSNIISNSQLFLNAVETFMRTVLERCNINVLEDRTIEVDIIIGRVVQVSEAKLSRNITTSSASSQSEKISGKTSEETVCEKCVLKDKQIKDLKDELAYAKYVKIVPSKLQSLMSKEVTDRTLFEPVHEQEILYADFPHVEVIANQDYCHVINDTVIVQMEKGKKFLLIRKIGDWSEIVEKSGGSSFFVLSKYIDDGNPNLTPTRKPSLTPFRRTSSGEEENVFKTFSTEGVISNKSEDMHEYEEIPADISETDIVLQEASEDEVFLREKQVVSRCLSDTQMKNFHPLQLAE